MAGIPIIIEAYNQHKDNAEVVENVCTLFMELTEYGKTKTFSVARTFVLNLGDSVLFAHVIRVF